MASNNSSKLNEEKFKWSVMFEMSTIGNPMKFLGIIIRRDRKRRIIDLCQEKYVDKNVKWFSFIESYPERTPVVNTPVSYQERKLRECDWECENISLEKSKTIENAPYREAVSSLLYLACTTRQDSSYAVNILRCQVSSTENDWVKRVFFWYLKCKLKGYVWDILVRQRAWKHFQMQDLLIVSATFPDYVWLWNKDT